MKRLTVILSICLLAASVGLAIAATRHEHHFSLTFTAHKVATATGTTFTTNRFAYKAPPSGTKPLLVNKTVFVMAPGTRTNSTAVKSCNATDKDLIGLGSHACPKSVIGTGSVSVITGNRLLDPIKDQATVFAHKGGLRVLLQPTASQVINLTMKGNTITSVLPVTCVGGKAPNCDRFAVLKSLQIKIRPHGSLIRTPSKCPRGGWTNKAIYTYANGDKETETSKSSCHR